MEFVDMIKKGDTKQNCKVENPDMVERITCRARL
ncbi:MAG: hypothetical protein IRD7MM_05285 [Candidatus Midichloria mitochondrii]|nr:hypothetical protein [Candidatus Midichloria mitochondrii]